MLRQSKHIVQYSINSKAYACLAFIRLHVNIAGAAVHGLEEDFVD